MERRGEAERHGGWEGGTGYLPHRNGNTRGMGRSRNSGVSARARFAKSIRRTWRRWRRIIVNKVLHADDPPHRLALGVAIGVFVTFTPTIGFQMAIVLFLAWLLGANKAVGLPVVWLSNPATLVPIFWPCYHLGRWLLHTPSISSAWWSSITHPPAGWAERVAFYWTRITEVFWPLWVGGIVVGLLAAYVSYYAVFYILCTYRMRRWGQLTPPRLIPSLVSEPVEEIFLRDEQKEEDITRRVDSPVEAATSRCKNPHSAA